MNAATVSVLIEPGFANFLVAMFAFEGMMNLSRNSRKGSAASSEAACSCVAASAGKVGLGVFVLVMM